MNAEAKTEEQRTEDAARIVGNADGPSSLALSGMLSPETTTRSTGAPSAAAAPRRSSAASSTTARSSHLTPLAGTTGRAPGASEVIYA